MKAVAVFAAVVAIATALYVGVDRSPEASAAPSPAIAPLTPYIASASPAPNTVDAGRADPLVLTLAQAIDPAAFDPAALAVFGRWSGVAEGTVDVEDGGRTLRFTPAEPFQAGEWVSASLRRGVALANGGSMDAGYGWGFWVAPEPGSLDMRELGERILLDENEEHVQPYGAYAGDYNGDRYPDLAIPNEVTADVRIMLNDGAGNYEQFSILEIPDGAWPSPNEGADFNGDGITDLAVGNAQNDILSLFAGDGRGSFSSIGGFAAGRNVRGVCPADFDHDGWPDVATVNMSEGPRDTRGNVAVLLNTADGTGNLVRTAQIASPGRGEKTCATADFNGDGHTDLAVGAYSSEEVLVFLGDGKGGLELFHRAPAAGQVWMIVAGDLDGDGNADIVSANRIGENLAVLLGDGTGNLAEPVTYQTGAMPLAVDVGDIDGDGDLDVVSSDFEGNSFTIYENDGTGALVNPRTHAASASGSCAVIHDRDLDGDMDITGIDETDDKVFLFENPGA